MDPTLARSLDELVAVVGETKPETVIGIDGTLGVGKTTLARELAPRIGGNILSLDDALPVTIRGRELTPDELAAIHRIAAERPGPPPPFVPYFELLDLDWLRDQARTLRGTGRPLIVEGIVLRAVLAVLPLEADTHVYVRVVNAHSFWGDGNILDVERIREADVHGFDQDLPPDHREIRDYHREHDPLGRADVIFERTTP